MSYDRASYADVEPRAPGMYFLRDALNCEGLGVTVVEGDADWSGMAHDHGEEGHEEVYLLIDGAATLTVEGEELALDPGDAVRVDPEDERHLSFETESKLIAAGAP